MSHNNRRFQFQLVEDLIVIQHQVPQIIESFDCVRVTRRGSGVFRGIDGVSLGQSF
jgi:hypothetical protein